MQATAFEKFKLNFPFEEYKEIKENTAKIGAFAARVKLDPDEAFELLEMLYGRYEDPMQDYVFIDNKTTWERFFETPDGVLRVYDFKGLTSIGYSGRELSEKLKSRAEKLKRLLEKGWAEYAEIKRREIKRSIKSNPFGNFIYTFGAVKVLLHKAKSSGSFLEQLVLHAAMTDAQLRMAIILLRQLKNKDTKIPKELIYQKGRSFTSERQIHKLAYSENVISNSEYKEISELYELRNRAVHRYFISDFEYAELPEITNRYEIIDDTLSKKLKDLENEQIKLGIGMTKSGSDDLNEETSRLISKNVLKRLSSEQPFADIPKRKLLFPHVDWRE